MSTTDIRDLDGSQKSLRSAIDGLDGPAAGGVKLSRKAARAERAAAEATPLKRHGRLICGVAAVLVIATVAALLI